MSSAVFLFVSLAVIFVSIVGVHSREDCPEVQPIADFDATKLDGKWYVWKMTNVTDHGNTRACYTRTLTSQSDGDIKLEAVWFEPEINKSDGEVRFLVGDKAAPTFTIRDSNNTAEIQAIGADYEFVIWIACVNETDFDEPVTLVIVKDLNVSAAEQSQIESKLDPETARTLVTVDQTNCF